jgi:hypothetical protein
MGTDYAEWYRWQRKVIREEALEFKGEKDNTSPINHDSQFPIISQENGRTE